MRLYLDEMQRVTEVFENRFHPRYPFADLSHMIRIWLNLPVEDPKATLLEDERAYLCGRISALSEGKDSAVAVTPTKIRAQHR